MAVLVVVDVAFHFLAVYNQLAKPKPLGKRNSLEVDRRSCKELAGKTHNCQSASHHNKV